MAKSSQNEKPDPVLELYLALQAACSCYKGCKMCKEHESQAIGVLREFLNRWRDNLS